MSTPKTVVILGGGVGGLVAARELRKSRAPVGKVLFEKSWQYTRL